MAQSGQRKCLCCKLFFDPDHRNRERQRYCSQPCAWRGLSSQARARGRQSCFERSPPEVIHGLDHLCSVARY